MGQNACQRFTFKHVCPSESRPNLNTHTRRSSREREKEGSRRRQAIQTNNIQTWLKTSNPLQRNGREPKLIFCNIPICCSQNPFVVQPPHSGAAAGPLPSRWSCPPAVANQTLARRRAVPASVRGAATFSASLARSSTSDRARRAQRAGNSWRSRT